MKKLKLTKNEKDLLVKILEDKVERFEREDLVVMLRGPIYKMVLDGIYDSCFRPHIKYGTSILDDKKESDENEYKIIEAMWQKVRIYLDDELRFD
jgi:hypothetical protein